MFQLHIRVFIIFLYQCLMSDSESQRNLNAVVHNMRLLAASLAMVTFSMLQLYYCNIL
jgi:hypothetical protein